MSLAEGTYKVLNTITGRYVLDKAGNSLFNSLDKAVSVIEKASKENKPYEPSDFVVEMYYLKYVKTVTPGTVIESKRINSKITQSARLSLAGDIAKRRHRLTALGLGELSYQQIKDLISTDAIDKEIKEEVSDIIIDLTELTEQFSKLNDKKNRK